MGFSYIYIMMIDDVNIMRQQGGTQARFPQSNNLSVWPGDFSWFP
jgi:hypothetical protein